MKNVLYIGNRETYLKFKKATPKGANIRLLSGLNQSSENIKSVIYDSENLMAAIINLDEIPKAIGRISELIEELLSECEQTKICIMAEGYSLMNNTLQLLLELGIQYLMPYFNDDGNINVYYQLLDENNSSNIEEVFSSGRKKTKEYNTTESSITVNVSSNNKEFEKKDNDKKGDTLKIISIGSIIPRMGATTIALQTLFALNTDKKKVCYIDSTRDNEYINSFLKAWDSQGSYDYEYNKFTLAGMDFYYNMNKNILKYIFTKGNYDYILYDYGCIYNDERKLNFFLNSDYRLLCAGSKCNEYVRLMEMCEQLKGNDINILFNLVKASKQKSISEFLKQYDYKYFFMPFILDEFELTEKTFRILNKIFAFDMYDEILQEIINKKKGK